jgi:hypothetical protein
MIERDLFSERGEAMPQGQMGSIGVEVDGVDATSVLYGDSKWCHLTGGRTESTLAADLYMGRRRRHAPLEPDQ